MARVYETCQGKQEQQRNVFLRAGGFRGPAVPLSCVVLGPSTARLNPQELPHTQDGAFAGSLLEFTEGPSEACPTWKGGAPVS